MKLKMDIMNPVLTLNNFDFEYLINRLSKEYLATPVAGRLPCDEYERNKRKRKSLEHLMETLIDSCYGMADTQYEEYDIVLQPHEVWEMAHHLGNDFHPNMIWEKP